MIGYWQFFPTEVNWGRIPVWGTGTVINAGGTELSEGAVYYVGTSRWGATSGS